jgi:hypothetical protein
VRHVLTTERLVLGPVTACDQIGLLAHWTAPDVRRFLFDGTILSAADITAASRTLAPQGSATTVARAVVEHALGPLRLPEVLRRTALSTAAVQGEDLEPIHRTGLVVSA